VTLSGPSSSGGWRTPRAALLGVGWILLVAAWIGGNPPFAGADEEWHYIRSEGIAQGELVGPAAPDARLGANDQQIAWTSQATRFVHVPGGKAPPSAGCYVLDPRTPAACIDQWHAPPARTRLVTPVGTYQPLPYLLPALAVGLAPHPSGALRAGRVASALIPLALLLVAIAALAPALTGLVLAVTPMVLFSISLLNGSGLEIAAAICFAACLLRLGREPRAAPPWIWPAIAVSGALLALSRSGSPLWLVVILAATAPLMPRPPRRPARITAAVLALAVVANRVWEAKYGPHVELGLANARNTIGPAFRQWWHAASDVVGRFGYLELRVPLAAILAWFGAILVLVVAALRRGSQRERIALALAGLVAVLLPPAFWLVQYRHTGFDLQGRHVLPVVALVPLVAGEIAWRGRARVSTALAAAAAALAAVVQLVAWWVDARRSAVGTGGRFWFLGDADWSPPVGWGLWAALAAAGTACLFAYAVVTLRSSRRRTRML
jgi:hypothetical protein